MNSSSRFAVRLTQVLVGALSCIAVTVAAPTVAPGPYYALPSWDQQLQCDLNACPRFIVLSNWGYGGGPGVPGAVLDRETGLVWQSRPSDYGAYTWSDAQTHCARFGLTMGRYGWRVPTLQELLSLYAVGFLASALPDGHPFSVQPGEYWSATTKYAAPTDLQFDFQGTPVYSGGGLIVFFNGGGTATAKAEQAWIARFPSAGPNYAADYRNKTSQLLVWCVRGGQGVDPQ